MERTDAFRTAFGILAAAALIATSTPASARPGPAGQGGEQGGQAPKLSPEEQAAMAAYEKAAKPGDQQAWLVSLAGSWEFEGTFWSAPGSEPMKSSGTAERTALLGGRVLREVVTSVMMGEPFEGIGHTGYDNVLGEFWSTWFDNMSTSLMTMTGHCEKGLCTYEGTNTDPLTGKPARARMTSRHEGDREVHEMFGPDPNGKEFKMMELVYTRRR